MKPMLCFFLMFSWLSPFGLAQQQDTVVFERLTIENGLSHNNVRAIMQDRKGYIWFGSYGGIDRYDGRSFKTFKYEHGNPNSLSNNHVTALWEDQEGMIWAATSSNGLCKIDGDTENVTRYLEQRDLPHGLQSSTVTRVMEDSQKRLWVGTARGLHLLDRESGRFHHFTSLADDPATISTNSYIFSLFEDKTGTVWVGTYGEGLNMINIPNSFCSPEDITFTRYVHDPRDNSSLSNNFVNTVFEDRQGYLWVGTNQGLNRLQAGTRQFSRYFHDPLDKNSLTGNEVSSIAEDAYGNLWIATSAGLNKLDPSRSRFGAYLHDPENPGSPNDNLIGPLLVDRSGILWTGSEDSGVNKYDPRVRRLKFLKHEPGNPNSLIHNEVKAIYEDRQGIIWIGTRAGLNAFDPAIGTYTLYRYDPDKPHGISSNHIQSIFEDKEGNIWIGAGEGIETTGSICMLERQTGRFTCFYPYEEKPVVENIFSILEDHTGLLWFATSNGIKSYDREKQNWSHYAFDPHNLSGISGPWARAMLEDRLGNIWVGTGSGGLNKLDRTTGNFSHYLNDNRTAFTEIHSLEEDSVGNLWVGTDGGGLYLFDPVTEKFEVFTEKEGLIDNAIHNIIEDDLGNLWLNTNKGLCRFDPRDRTFTAFDFAEGAEGEHFVSGNLNTGACFKGRDGRLYFGGKHGFTSFHPDELHINNSIPPIAVTQVLLFDKPLMKSFRREELVFDHHQNFLSFEFAVLSFTNPHKNRYAYKLENFDEDWIFSGSRNFASYTNLPPGAYTFRVKGANNDGMWNQEGEALTFTIQPPWWETSWAYCGYGLLLLAGLLLGKRETVRRERLRSEVQIQQLEADKLRELDTLKSGFFSNISHEFRTPLSLIKGLVQKIKSEDQRQPSQYTEYDLIYRNADRLLQLVDQLLDLSRLEAGKLNLNPLPGDVMAFLTFLLGSFSSLFENKDIRYTYDLDKQPLWVLFDADKLEKIVTNLLSNSSKFTPAGGKVAVEVKTEPLSLGHTALLIKVEDQGIGITPELQTRIFDRFFQVDPNSAGINGGTGIGLALTKELIELHGGTISVESTLGQGTTFFLTIPLQLTAASEAQQPLNGRLRNINLLPSEVEGQASVDEDNHQQARRKTGRTVILVVEDNADLRHFIVSILTDQYNVYEADNGIQGWEKALEIFPDLIISDVMMPAMDGITLCDKLKSDERTSHISLILLTAKADIDNKLEGLQSGADDYLTKPFDIEELKLRINNQLTRRKKLQERYSRLIRLQPKESEGESLDEKFLQKILLIAEEHLDDPTFDVESFSKEIGMSRVHLYRKLKTLTDQSPGEFVRTFRLKKAAMLLEQQQGNISEVAYAVGFSSLSYFTRSFRAQYGLSPSAFMASSRGKG